MKPVLQLHVNPGSSLVHVWAHPPLLVRHWSTSEEQNKFVDSKGCLYYKHVPKHCTPAILVAVHSDRPGVVCLQFITLLSDPVQSTLSRNTGPVEILNLVLASLKVSAPVTGKPSCLHTTVASLVLNPSLHIVPQALFMQT